MPYKDPEKRRAAVRESNRRRRAGGEGKPARKPRGGELPALEELRFRTAQDVVRLLNTEVEAVRGDAGLDTVNRARTVGYLAGLLLRAIETGDVEERIRALEAKLLGGDDGEIHAPAH
jgi:hypothetical protein